MIEPAVLVPFEVIAPKGRATPVVYNSPHSGNVYPAAFLESTHLSVPDLRKSADLYVDTLLAGAAARGVPVMRAHFPRCFVDVNREPYELDPAMFEGRLPQGMNTRSSRVQAGYGTIPRLVAEHQPIYRRKLPASEALRRIDSYYLPYHASLRRMLQDTRHGFGTAVLIDWHSMPSAVFPPHRAIDVVIGDRNGTSCSPDVTAAVESALIGMGFTVQRNLPYAGGFITQHYGHPAQGVHAVQIEINRSLYMDEESQQPHDGFAATEQAITALTETILAMASDLVRPMAAE